MKRKNITDIDCPLAARPVVMGEKLYNEWKKWTAEDVEDDPSTRIVGWYRGVPVYKEL